MENLCTNCENSDHGQVLIASWKVLLHLLKESGKKIDLHYLTELQLAAGIQGEQTMPLFTQIILKNLK